jgi:hypothetical protein
MYYQFNKNGRCVSTSTGEIEPMDGITSVYSYKNFDNLSEIALVNGEVVKRKVVEDEPNNISASGNL